MIGTSKDDVYGRACAMYGFLNVAGVYVDNPDNSFTTIPMGVPKKHSIWVFFSLFIFHSTFTTWGIAHLVCATTLHEP